MAYHADQDPSHKSEPTVVSETKKYFLGCMRHAMEALDHDGSNLELVAGGHPMVVSRTGHVIGLCRLLRA